MREKTIEYKYLMDAGEILIIINLTNELKAVLM